MVPFKCTTTTLVQNQNSFLGETNTVQIDHGLPICSHHNPCRKRFIVPDFIMHQFFRVINYMLLLLLILQATTTAVVHSLGNTFCTVSIKQEVGMLARGFQYLS